MNLVPPHNSLTEMERQLHKALSISESILTNIYDLADERTADTYAGIILLFDAQLEYFLPALAPKSEEEWADLTDVLIIQSQWFLKEAATFSLLDLEMQKELRELAHSRLETLPAVFAAVINQSEPPMLLDAPSSIPALCAA